MQRPSAKPRKTAQQSSSAAVELQRVAERYAVAITPSVEGLIDAASPGDPIARQYLPDVRELDQRPDELADPIGDDTHEAVRGLIHR